MGRNKWMLSFAVMMLVSATGSASGATSETWLAISGSVDPKISTLPDLGPADTGMVVGFDVVLVIQQALVEEYLKQILDPTSPNYGRYLTPAEYCARFGLSADQISQIEKVYTAFGLAASHGGCNLIALSGTIAQIQTAFQTQIRRYLYVDPHYGKSPQIANSTSLMVPSSIAAWIADVIGLDGLMARPIPGAPVSPKF